MVTLTAGNYAGLAVKGVVAPLARAPADERRISASTTIKSAAEPKSAEKNARRSEFGPPAFPVTIPSNEFVAMIAIYWLWNTFCSHSYNRERYRQADEATGPPTSLDRLTESHRVLEIFEVTRQTIRSWPWTMRRGRAGV